MEMIVDPNSRGRLVSVSSKNSSTPHRDERLRLLGKHAAPADANAAAFAAWLAPVRVANGSSWPNV